MIKLETEKGKLVSQNTHFINKKAEYEDRISKANESIVLFLLMLD